jgi:hypothetical protein
MPQRPSRNPSTSLDTSASDVRPSYLQKKVKDEERAHTCTRRCVYSRATAHGEAKPKAQTPVRRSDAAGQASR